MPITSTKETSVIHSTFVLERSYPKSPERVFSAFSSLEQKRRWFFAEGEGHHEVEKFEMDFQVGGTDHLRLKQGTPFPGVAMVTQDSYLDILPNRRIVTVSTMTLGDKRISCALITFEFLPTAQGTDLICTHQGTFFEGSGGPEMREEGWRKLLDALTVELSRA